MSINSKPPGKPIPGDPSWIEWERQTRQEREKREDKRYWDTWQANGFSEEFGDVIAVFKAPDYDEAWQKALSDNVEWETDEGEEVFYGRIEVYEVEIFSMAMIEPESKPKLEYYPLLEELAK